MRFDAEYIGAQTSLEGDTLISFWVSEAPRIEEGEKLSISCEKQGKKSLKALRYFWALCTEIAHELRSDKDTIYLLQLNKYGDFVDLDIDRNSLDGLKRQFKFTEILDETENRIYVRCYYGLSTYTKDEMRHLLNGTVQDAQDIGVETWTPDEIERVIALWKGGK